MLARAKAGWAKFGFLNRSCAFDGAPKHERDASGLAPIRVHSFSVIALIGANVPFAPPFLTEAPDERDSSDYIGAIAELMRRSHRRPSDEDVIWEAQVDFRRRKEHA